MAANEESTVMDTHPGASGVPEVGVALSEPNPHFWRVSLPQQGNWYTRSVFDEEIGLAAAL